MAIVLASALDLRLVELLRRVGLKLLGSRTTLAERVRLLGVGTLLYKNSHVIDFDA